MIENIHHLHILISKREGGIFSQKRNQGEPGFQGLHLQTLSSKKAFQGLHLQTLSSKKGFQGLCLQTLSVKKSELQENRTRRSRLGTISGASSNS